MLRAIDIYTGRLLWEKSIPGVGKLYDNTAHNPVPMQLAPTTSPLLMGSMLCMSNAA